MLFTKAFWILCLPAFIITLQPVRAENSVAATIEIPGGMAATSRVLGLRGTPDPATAIERIFRHLLQTEPTPGSIAAPNPVRLNLLTFLKAHARLMQKLEKHGIDSAKEIYFPMTGSADQLESTRNVLSYAGIKSIIRNGAAVDQAVVELEIEGDKKSLDATVVAAGLGLNGSQSALRLQPPARAYLSPDRQTWDRIVPGNKSEPLFKRFAEHPEAMRLYLGITACAKDTATALTSSVSPSKLLDSAEILHLFGPDIRIENGAIRFPGKTEAWVTFLSARGSQLPIDRLLAEGGMPLLFYSSVFAALEEVQDYITDSPERLKSYYKVVKEYGSGRCCSTVTASVGQDLPRIFRQMKIDAHGMMPAMDRRLAHALLRWIAPDRAGDPATVTPEVLAKLLPRPGISPYSETSRADILEFFRYLNDTRPQALSAESIDVLMSNPEKAPVFIDLIGDMAPDAALLAKYLKYCEKSAAAGPRGWNLNRTRTSQSIFFLISALSRERALSQAEANTLLEAALQSFDIEEEAAFAKNTADFLSRRLLPQLLQVADDSSDRLRSALSGKQADMKLLYEGREFTLNLSSRRFIRIAETMQAQSHTPLAVLLDVFALLREIESGPVDIARTAETLAARLSEIRTAEKTPVTSTGDENFARISLLKKKIESKKGWNSPAQLKELAVRLHTELGVTLLTYCYAYSAMPDTDILTYDPNFVRKHRFFPATNSPSWSPSRFVQNDEFGGLMEGSLAGLGIELTRLQSAQADQELKKSHNIEMVHSVTAGIRQMQPELLTERGQEYVALAARLGSSLVPILGSGEDQPLEAWLLDSLKSLISPERLDKLKVQLEKGNTAAALGILSRSELFLLGQEFYYSSESRLCPADTCTILDRLNGIVPRKDSVEYNSFQEEVAQYGVSLHSRIGLSRLSFNLIDPYERLEKNLRPQNVYDRLCDLKIRIAELNYDLGLPASLGEVQANVALKSILPRTVEDWEEAVERINQLSTKAVSLWFDELIKKGVLVQEVASSRTPDL